MVVLFKLFDTHTGGVCDFTKHPHCVQRPPEFFENHLQGEKVKELMQYETATVVILERPALNRKCSMDHAKEHNDWLTFPSKDHKVNITRCTLLAATNSNKTQELAKFTKQHDEWFEFIRGASNLTHSAGFPFLKWYDDVPRVVEVPFDILVDKQRSKNVFRSIWETAGLDPDAARGYGKQLADAVASV